jgi:hypothetical protein
VRKIKTFFNMNLNVLNKVDTLKSLIKEIRDNLNSQKVRKESKNGTMKKDTKLLLKQEKQNKWYNEFLKLKKNYVEEYLKQKEIEDEIKGNQIVMQEKPKGKEQPEYKLTLK